MISIIMPVVYIITGAVITLAATVWKSLAILNRNSAGSVRTPGVLAGEWEVFSRSLMVKLALTRTTRFIQCKMSCYRRNVNGWVGTPWGDSLLPPSPVSRPGGQTVYIWL